MTKLVEKNVEKKVALTEKQIKGLEILKIVNKQVCSEELRTQFANLLKERNFDTEKVNSINATLASLVSKGFVDKEPMAYNKKMLTHYSINEKGLQKLNNNIDTTDNEENEE